VFRGGPEQRTHGARGPAARFRHNTGVHSPDTGRRVAGARRRPGRAPAGGGVQVRVRRAESSGRPSIRQRVRRT